MNTILVPLDGSPFGEQALPTALAIARRAGASLTLAHAHQLVAPVVTVSGELMDDPSVDALIRDEEQAYLDGMVERLRAGGEVPVSGALLEGPVVGAIIDYAREIGAGLIVICTHGRGGLARAWLGSVTDRLIRQSPVPVLALHAAEEPPVAQPEPFFHHILIPLDGSALAERAIPMALEIGRLSHARYTLIQVVEPVLRGFYVDGLAPHVDTSALETSWEHAQAYLKALAAPLRAEGLVVDVQSPVGQPAEALLKYAGDQAADLIAMTTRGHGGLTRLLLGSVADKLVRGSSVPLLIAHGAEVGFEEPAAAAATGQP